MNETRIELGVGLVRELASFDDSISKLSMIMQDFGLKKSELIDLRIGYEELCEIHDLARELHESVRKLKQ